jgi:hypothetical protein
MTDIFSIPALPTLLTDHAARPRRTHPDVSDYLLRDIGLLEAGLFDRPVSAQGARIHPGRR